MTDYLLSDEDAAMVRRITTDARRAGSDAVASAVAIHAGLLKDARENLRLLLPQVESCRRAIALRELALRLLEPES